MIGNLERRTVRNSDNELKTVILDHDDSISVEATVSVIGKWVKLPNSYFNCLHGSLDLSTDYSLEYKFNQEKLIGELRLMYESLLTDMERLEKSIKPMEMENLNMK